MDKATANLRSRVSSARRAIPKGPGPGASDARSATAAGLRADRKVISQMRQELGASRGGRMDKAKAASKASAPAAKPGPRIGGKASGPKLGSKRPGTSAPAGSVPKRMFDRSTGATGGMGKGTKVAASKMAAKAPAKTGKAAPNKAKAAYKAATSKAREAKMMAGGRTSARGLGKRQDAGAQRIRASVKAVQAAQAKVRAMEKKRGVGGRKRKG
jgi:hypothetical protein